MDVGLHKPSPADDIGCKVCMQTEDGEVIGQLDFYCPRTGTYMLSICCLDGDFVGPITVPTRDIIPDPESDSLYQVVEQKKDKKIPACLKDVPGIDQLSIRDDRVDKSDQEPEVVHEDPVPCERPDSAIDWNLFTDNFYREAEQQLRESKKPGRFLNRNDDDVESDGDRDVSVVPDDEVEEWTEIPFDADIIVIRSTADPAYAMAVDLIHLNNRIGVAAFGPEINRFHPILCFAVSCCLPNEEVIIFVFMLKREDGQVNEEMTTAMADLLKSDESIVKVVHDCSPMADMLKGRFGIIWSAAEVQDTMCYDIEYRAEQRDLYVWLTGRNNLPKPRASVQVEDLLINHMDLEIGADCFPHNGKPDEYTCLMKPELTTEAENLLKRKTLFLPFLIDTILLKADEKGFQMKELNELIQTRLELRRESEDGEISQFQVDERYGVRMSGMYVNPHSMARRDRQALEAIRAAAAASLVAGKVPLAKSDLKWIRDEDLPPGLKWQPVKSSSSSWDEEAGSSSSGSGAEAEQGNLYWWSRDEEGGDRRGPSRAPAGHAHLLNNKRGPEFACHRRHC